VKFPFNKSNDPLLEGDGYWKNFAKIFWSYFRPMTILFSVLLILEVVGNWQKITAQKFLFAIGINSGVCLLIGVFSASLNALSPRSIRIQPVSLPQQKTRLTSTHVKVKKIFHGLLLLPQVACIGLLIIGIYVSFINLNLKTLVLIVFILGIYAFICMQSVRGKKKIFLIISMAIALAFLACWILIFINSSQYRGVITTGIIGTASTFICLILRYSDVYHDSNKL